MAAKLYYGVTDVPPWYSTLAFAFQQLMVCVGAVIALPLMVADQICTTGRPLARVMLIGTTLFTAGLSTLLQTTLGIRLPLLQGPSASFLPPIIAMGTLKQFQCPNHEDILERENGTAILDELWMERICIVQGALLLASIVHMLIGATGLIGLIARFVGPLTIAPLMLSLHLSLIPIVMDYMTKHWVSSLIIFGIILCALYLPNVPFPCCSIQNRRCTVTKVPLFALFPYFITMMSVWFLCLLFSVTGVFNPVRDRAAYIGANQTQLISDAPWFRVPYPFQWGIPTLNVAIFIGMLTGTICSVLESVGDYHALAKLCSEPRPPAHAVNRGIFMEGLCCCIGGLLGCGLSLTSYSENIGVIGITKVASRFTLQIAGFILMFLGLFTKFGALFATLPDPIVGGTLVVSISMVGGVGLSSMQSADFHLSRNIAIMGLSVTAGMMIPKLVDRFPIYTGITVVDECLTILLQTQVIIGALTGFLLDNTVPGATMAQRGLIHTDENSTTELPKTIKEKEGVPLQSVYDFPRILSKYVEKVTFLRFIPICPTYKAPTKPRRRTKRESIRI